MFLFFEKNKTEILFTKSLLKLQRTATEFVREKIHEIDWRANRLTGIKGARGAGKTTLVLQYLKLNPSPAGQALYVSLDDLYISAHRLYDLGAEFAQKGGQLFMIDKLHR